MSEADLVERQRKMLRSFHKASQNYIQSQEAARTHQETDKQASKATNDQARASALEQVELVREKFNLADNAQANGSLDRKKRSQILFQKKRNRISEALKGIGLDHLLMAQTKFVPSQHLGSDPDVQLRKCVVESDEVERQLLSTVDVLLKFRRSRERLSWWITALVTVGIIVAVVLGFWRWQIWQDDRLYRSAIAAADVGQWEQASKSLEQLSARSGTYQELQPRLHEGYYYLALKAVDTQQWELAVTTVRTLKELAPNHKSITELIDSNADLKNFIQYQLWSSDVKFISKITNPDQVRDIAFSPNEAILANSTMKEVRLWNVEQRTMIRSLSGHAGTIISIAFSPDGQILASASHDKTVKLWNVQTGEEIRTLSGHLGQISAVAFSPNGQTLASGSSDHTAKLWNVQTGEEIYTLSGHTGWVTGVAFSPDGQILASTSHDKTVKLWNVQTGEEIRTLSGHLGQVKGVVFSPNGQTLASASIDKTVKLWNAQTGEEIRTLSGHSGWVMSITFSPDGQFLASGDSARTAKLWNTANGQQVNTIESQSSIYTLDFSPTGAYLAVSNDHTVEIWGPQ